MNKIRRSKKNLDDEEAVLWKRFFEIADDLAGESESYRFVDPELELSIAREMHQASPRLNVEDLGAELNDAEWALISVPKQVFDIDRLEAAITLGQISKEVVERHTERPAAVPHKKF